MFDRSGTGTGHGGRGSSLGVDVARAAIGSCAELLGALVVDEVPWSKLADLAVSLDGLQACLDALQAEVIAAFASADTWAADGATSPTAWLTSHTESTRRAATQSARVGRALRGLPVAQATARAGHLGAAKTRALAAVAADLPDAVAENEAFLVEQLVKLQADQAARFLAHWRAMVDPNGEGDRAARIHARRGLSLSETYEGAWRIDGYLDPEGGALLARSLEHLSRQRYHDEAATAAALANGGVTPSTDATTRAGLVTSTARQRRADALVDLARHALDPATDEQPMNVPSLLVLAEARPLTNPTTPPGAPGGTTDTGTMLRAEVVGRLACDANLSRVITRTGTSQPIDLSRQARLPSPAQRRAILARDRGCTFPGCERPPGWCEAHHIEWWQHGGPTDLANLTLLCSHHHHVVHGGVVRVARAPNGTLCWTRPDGTPLTVPKHGRPDAA